MALTLGQLRQFCAEVVSPDSAGSTADREFMLWINSALMRCYTELHWDRIQFERKITVVPAVAGTDLTVVQGSRAVAFGSPITQAYLDDRWELQAEDESRWSFELDSIDALLPATGTLIEGDEWVAASAGPVNYNWVKTRYTLPDNAQRVSRVQVMENQQEVAILTPTEFDRQKMIAPNQSGNQPRFCCFRRGKLEIWPHPGSTYTKLGVTYIKGPTVLDDAELDDVEIDWDDSWRDLIQKALVLEGAWAQGENSPISYGVAKAEWEDRKAAYHQIAQKPDMTGQMQLQEPGEKDMRLDRSVNWMGPLRDL